MIQMFPGKIVETQLPLNLKKNSWLLEEEQVQVLGPDPLTLGLD